jgi:hypothetical protein
MPSPSAIAVWVNPLALRSRRSLGPAKIFWSAIPSTLDKNYTRIGPDVHLADFTIMTNLQSLPVNGNTAFPLFLALHAGFSGVFRAAM